VCTVTFTSVLLHRGVGQIPCVPHLPLTDLFACQGAVVSRRQVLAAGLTVGQIEHRLARGRWVRMLSGIYALAGAPVTWHSWAWAGVLSCPGSVLAVSSAAHLWAWTRPAKPVEVAIPPGRRPRWPEEQLVPRRLSVPSHQIVRIDGLPTTNRLRTAVDLAHLMPSNEAQPIIDRQLLLGSIDLDALAHEVAHSKRHGSRQARFLLRSAGDGAASFAERLAHREFKAAGLMGWLANYRVQVVGRWLIIDIAFPELKVAVEISGWAFHSTPEQRARDEQRVADLQLAGWIVLTFSWWDLTHRPDWVVARVRQAIGVRQAAS